MQVSALIYLQVDLNFYTNLRGLGYDKQKI